MAVTFMNFDSLNIFSISLDRNVQNILGFYRILSVFDLLKVEIILCYKIYNSGGLPKCEGNIIILL